MPKKMHYSDSVFVPMCADFIHVGHINILDGAAKHGKVVVLLMTDAAMMTYKRSPRMNYDQRKAIISSFKQVVGVLPCTGPGDYEEKINIHQPGFFYHGDDWKCGPQKKAREQVIAAVAKYGGQMIEPAYTKQVSSTTLQGMFEASLGESKHLGILVRAALNDIKRTERVATAEMGIGEEVLKNIIDGKELDGQTLDTVCRTLSHHYPISRKHLLVDPDKSKEGVWIMTSKETQKSERVFDRTNANQDTTPYYRYMDTATSLQSPFKPELIEELVVVEDNDPLNPKVVMNNGHLLGQLTFFIGEVNYYCTVRGVRHCVPMKTGDSCLISPYVPHSFTSRGGYAAIIACTFSGYVRDVLGDLVHNNPVDMLKAAGDMRFPHTVLASRIERFSERLGLTKPEIRDRLVNGSRCGRTFKPLLVDSVLAGNVHIPGAESVVEELCSILNVQKSDLHAAEMEQKDEVTYQSGPTEPPSRTRCYPLASSKHTPDVGGYEMYLRGEHATTSQYFTYLYNYGAESVTMEWGSCTHQLKQGDSACIRPFTKYTLSSAGENMAKIIVMKIPGSVNLSVMNEVALFAPEGAVKMSATTQKWF